MNVTDIGDNVSNNAFTTITVNVIQAPGSPVNNGDNPITGGNGDDVLIGDAGGVKTVLVPGTNYNIAFILDVSGSMNAAIDATGSTAPSDLTTQRIAMVKSAVQNYLKETVLPFLSKDDGSGLGGKVNLTFIEFSSGANAFGWNNQGNNAAKFSATFDTATLKAKLAEVGAGTKTLDQITNEIVTNILNAASGGTDYEAAFNRAAEWFTYTASGANNVATSGYKNLTFFITDGDPSAYLEVSGSNNENVPKISTATQQTILEQSIKAFSDVRDNGGTVLSKLSDVHAIGVGPLVKKPWLDFFDNTTDGGDGFIVTTNKTVDVSPVTGWRANFDNNTGTSGHQNNPDSWVRSDNTQADAATVTWGGLVLADTIANNNQVATYEGPEFTITTTQPHAYTSFEYRHANWVGGDSFTWTLQQKIGADWVDVDKGTNAQTNTGASAAVTMSSKLVASNATYRYVFTVEDQSTTGGKYLVHLDNIRVNYADATNNVTGKQGQSEIIMTADQLKYALEAGGLSATLNPVGNDKLFGGNGNDVMFGDTINTDWLDWTGRNLDAANQPDAAGSGMAALKEYLSLSPSDYTLVNAGLGVQDIDLYNYIKAESNTTTGISRFNATADTRGGNDVLDGGAGNDILYGQGGADILIGGAGNDILFGGTGADTFVWGKSLNTTTGNLVTNGTNDADGSTDTIKDFNLAQGDKVDAKALLDALGWNGSMVTLSQFVTVTGNTIDIHNAADTISVNIVVEGQTFTDLNDMIAKTNFQTT